MKSTLFALSAITVMAISSCYIGVEGRHRRHAGSLEIHADNATPKDSLHTSAIAEPNKKDSMESPVAPSGVK